MAVAVDMRGDDWPERFRRQNRFPSECPGSPLFRAGNNAEFHPALLYEEQRFSGIALDKDRGVFSEVTNCLPTPAVERNTWGACLPVSISLR